MPIQKFRSVEDMSAALRPDRGISLEKRITDLLAVSAALAPSIVRPKGVFKFRTFEDMQQQSLQWQRERLAAGRERIEVGSVVEE